MTGRVGGVVRAATTALAALVLAHNLIFLAGYGAAFRSAMALTGHDARWIIAVGVVLSLGFALLASASWRLRHLRGLARAAGAQRLPGEPDARAFLRRWLAWWFALTLATALLFVLQENLELARIGQPLPGMGVLASAVYPHAVAIIAAVALVVSLVAALFGWKLDLLIARIRAARSRSGAGAVPAFLPNDPPDRRGSILGRRKAGRAPPIGLAL